MHITTIFINFIITQDTQYAKVKNKIQGKINQCPFKEKICFISNISRCKD